VVRRGGARNYIQSVEKGVQRQLLKGATTGQPVVDLRVTIVDGSLTVSTPPTRRSRPPGPGAKDGAEHGQISMLEPWTR